MRLHEGLYDGEVAFASGRRGHPHQAVAPRRPRRAEVVARGLRDAHRLHAAFGIEERDVVLLAVCEHAGEARQHAAVGAVGQAGYYIFSVDHKAVCVGRKVIQADPSIRRGRKVTPVGTERHAVNRTLVAGQLPVDHWHDIIGEPTLADAILDRLVHNAYRIKLKGGSLRKKHANLT